VGTTAEFLSMTIGIVQRVFLHFVTCLQPVRSHRVLPRDLSQASGTKARVRSKGGGSALGVRPSGTRLSISLRDPTGCSLN